MFKILTNFTLLEFKELCSEVYPFIARNTRSTDMPQIRRGCSLELSLEQRILLFGTSSVIMLQRTILITGIDHLV